MNSVIIEQTNKQSATEGEEEGEKNIYKTAFKYFKQITDLSSIIDLKKYDNNFANKIVRLEAPNNNNIVNINNDHIKCVHHLHCNTADHFKPFNQWRMYTLKDPAIAGLFIIPGIIKENYRNDWFEYFHDHLPLRHDLNLKANIPLFDQKANNKNFNNLRWITFGYHHDWDSKVYSLNQSSVDIPERVEDLCNIVSTYLNITFKPQAGIVNYYKRKSSLCFHTDYSEPDHTLPLLSLSLGSSAIFLIGGLSKDDCDTPITPILLRDSDLLIMSDKSRLALHAVAKIVSIDQLDNGNNNKYNQKTIKRINLNVRQMMR